MPKKRPPPPKLPADWVQRASSLLKTMLNRVNQLEAKNHQLATDLELHHNTLVWLRSTDPKSSVICPSCTYHTLKGHEPNCPTYKLLHSIDQNNYP